MNVLPFPAAIPADPIGQAMSEPPYREQLDALGELLRAAKRAEVAADGAGRAAARQHARSLIGAARQLGFSPATLATILGMTEESIRLQSGPTFPMLPSVFLAIALTQDSLPLALDIRDPGKGSQIAVDTVRLLRWYLVALRKASVP